MTSDRRPPAVRTGDAVIRAGRLLAELAVAAMMVLITLDIVMRSVFDKSLLISDEMSGYLLVVMTFCGAAESLRKGALLRIEIVLHLFGPRMRGALCALFDLLALGLTLIVFRQVVLFTWSTWTRGMVAPTLLETPLWIPQLAMPVGCAILVIAHLLELYDNLGRAFGRAPHADRDRHGLDASA